MLEIDIQKIASQSAQDIAQKLPEKLGSILGKLQPGASNDEIISAVYLAAVEVSGTVTANMLFAYHKELSATLENLLASNQR